MRGDSNPFENSSVGQFERELACLDKKKLGMLGSDIQPLESEVSIYLVSLVSQRCLRLHIFIDF